MRKAAGALPGINAVTPNHTRSHCPLRHTHSFVKIYFYFGVASVKQYELLIY